MMTLENMGLLEKTHTSSGRIPSEKGYRYYVDNLMELKEMNAEDMLKLQIVFKNQQLFFHILALLIFCLYQLIFLFYLLNCINIIA